MGKIESRHLTQKNFDIFASAQDPSNGSGNFSGRDTCGRDLIKKRLKGVMVLAINDGDVDREFGQITSGFEPAESSSDDYYARPGFVHEALLCIGCDLRLAPCILTLYRFEYEREDRSFLRR